VVHRRLRPLGRVLTRGQRVCRPRLPEVVAFTQPFNEASLAVMRRLGMTYRRDCMHVDLPHVVYAIEQRTTTA
jgi:RimJ/RimL family protein N-acetyltransferase